MILSKEIFRVLQRGKQEKNAALMNLYNRQIDTILKKVSALHEDLQYDYGLEISELNRPRS